MVQFATASPDEVRAKYAAYREAHDLKDPEPSRYANTAGVAFLTDPLRFAFRGRLWEAPPITFRDGQELDGLLLEWSSVSNDPDPHSRLERRAAWYEAAAAKIFAVARPERRYLISRTLYALGWLRNPFRQATEVEISQLLGFLLACRTISNGPGSARVEGATPSTSGTTLPSSSGTTPPGLALTGTR